MDKDQNVKKLEKRLRKLETALNIVSSHSEKEETLMKEQFISFSQTLPLPMIICNETGDILFTNQSAQQIIGDDAHAFDALKVTDLFEYQDDRSFFTDMLCQQEEIKGLEVHIKKRNGFSFPTSVFSRQIVFEGVPAILIIIDDLTHIKKLEKRIKKLEASLKIISFHSGKEESRIRGLKELAEARYRDLFENMSQGVYQSTPAGRFLVVNPAMARILGYDSPEELMATLTDIGQQLYVDSKDRRILLQQLKDQRAVNGFETQFFRKDGQKIWVSLHANVVLDNHNKIRLTEGWIEDITERKRSQEAINLNQARQKALLTLNQMTENTIEELVDFAFEEGIKLTKSKIGFFGFVDNEHKTIDIHCWSPNIRDGDAYAKERHAYPLERSGLWTEAVRRRRVIIINDYDAAHALRKDYPDKHLRVLRHMSVPVFDKNCLVAVMGVGNKEENYDDSDVTQLTLLLEGMWLLIQRRRNENELAKYRENLEKLVARRTAELEQANEELRAAKEAADSATRAKSDFLANMSHEIRTPMNGVISAVDLALQETLSPSVEKYLKIIKNSGYTLLGIINDILDFSKIEARQLELEETDFLMADILDRVKDIFLSKLADKGIELWFDIETDIPRILMGDPLRLQQIITNLVGNAIKFTDKGGTIILGIKCNASQNQHVQLAFFVKDTGIGIKKEYMANLFNPFSQEDASTTRKYGGSGLGLSICRQLVEIMGGHIGAESRVGQGSTFHFTLPFKYDAEDGQEKLTVPDSIRALTMMLIDPHPEHALIIKKILDSLGIQSERLNDYDRALDVIVKNKEALRFDLLIVNSCLMDGMVLKFFEQIRFHLPDSFPILVIGNYNGQKMVASVLSKWHWMGVLKPVTAAVFLEALVALYRKEGGGEAPPKQTSIPKIRDYRQFFRNKRILLVEDDLTNQTVALAILDKVDLRVVVVKNGLEAVKAVKDDEPYEAVLMDVQMPEMDGYEATQRIRSWEREIRSSKRIPIIAMTAHALKGDAEKCLQAGMDAYISKPINQGRLFDVLFKSLHAHKTDLPNNAVKCTPEDQGGAEEFPDAIDGINLQHVFTNLNIDWLTFKKILASFWIANKETIHTIKKALQTKDFSALVRLAHSLKGSSANIGAEDLEIAARRVEMMGKKVLESGPEALEETLINPLGCELTRLLTSIGAFVMPPATKAPEDAQEQVSGELIELLPHLADAIENFEHQKLEHYLAIVQKYRHIPVIAELESHIRQYNFDEALEMIQKIENNALPAHS